jgi:uncharacterized cofD-like protein
MSPADDPLTVGDSPRVVALGGGHGLAATLSALRHVTRRLTAVVTVADDGGSSGRLRRELGVLPPGDLRMALAALCGDDEWGRTWSDVLQHRFRGGGELHGHAVGNLFIAALWERFGGNPVVALDWVSRLVHAQGRVLPMASCPLDITATVVGADPMRPDDVTEVFGQGAVASTTGRVAGISLLPPAPPACQEAVTAVREADWVVFGPGSWFTSVLPHLLVPDLRAALVETPARRVVALNLAPQPGETAGFSPETHLEVLAEHAPELRVHAVLADPGTVVDADGLVRAAAGLGAQVWLEPIAAPDGTPRHDPVLLAAAYRRIFGPALEESRTGGGHRWR